MSNSNNPSEETVHVNSYSRDDGTQVDDYYRAKPGGGSLAGNNSSNNIDVPNTVSKVLNTVGDGKSFEDECPALTKLFGSATVSNKNTSANADSPGDIVLEGGVVFIRIVLEKVVQVAKVAIEAIAVAAPIVAALYGAYKTGKAVYDKVSDIFSSKESQTQIKTVNTTIQGLRETQGLQKRNIDLLSKKAATAQNQDEYSKLYEELAKQKAQYDKNDTLLGRIEYSAQRQDYETLTQDLQEYQNNAQEAVNEGKNTEYNSDWMHPNNENLGDALNNAFNQPAHADEYNPRVQNSTPATSQSEDVESQAPENNSFPPLKTGITKTVEQVQTLIKPIIIKAVNGPVLSMLDTKMGKIALDLINQILNQNAKDAADLMQISLYGPENLEPTSDYTPINKDFNAKMNEALGITGTNIEIPKDWNGVVFDKDSHLAQSLNNSEQLKDIFSDVFKNNKIENNKFSFRLDSKYEPNLFKSIHGGTIINPKIENGYFTGILYDKYDFDLLLDEYMDKNKIKNTVINNLAYYLQGTNILNNYYLIVPIKIKF